MTVKNAKLNQLKSVPQGHQLIFSAEGGSSFGGKF